MQFKNILFWGFFVIFFIFVIFITYKATTNKYYLQEYCYFFGENSTKECTVITESGYCKEFTYYGVMNNRAIGCWDVRVLKGEVLPRQVITNLSREEYMQTLDN